MHFFLASLQQRCNSDHPIGWGPPPSSNMSDQMDSQCLCQLEVLIFNRWNEFAWRTMFPMAQKCSETPDGSFLLQMALFCSRWLFFCSRWIFFAPDGSFFLQVALSSSRWLLFCSRLGMIVVFCLCPNELRESKKVLYRKFIMPITDYSTYIIHMYILYSKESGKDYFGLKLIQ